MDSLFVDCFFQLSAKIREFEPHVLVVRSAKVGADALTASSALKVRAYNQYCQEMF
jgi:hypothetical protein